MLLRGHTPAKDVQPACLFPLNVPSGLATHASTLFSRNLTAFLQAFTKDKSFHLDLSDDIQQGALITHAGQVVHSRTKEALAKVSSERSSL